MWPKVEDRYLAHVQAPTSIKKGSKSSTANELSVHPRPTLHQSPIGNGNVSVFCMMPYRLDIGTVGVNDLIGDSVGSCSSKEGRGPEEALNGVVLLPVCRDRELNIGRGHVHFFHTSLYANRLNANDRKYIN